MRMCYADPPYPGKAVLYKNEPTFAGEVDHVELIASLRSSYDGWALSTSADALKYVLSLCPEGVHVLPWVKPNGVARATIGKHNSWEPLIVWPGRELPPGFRDWLYAKPARSGGSLLGRKPIAFCAFMFRALGILPGDELVDLYPGTGIVGRCFAELSRGCSGDAPQSCSDDRSAVASAFLAKLGNVSPRARDDGSAPISVELPSSDVSTPAPDDASPAAESDGSAPRLPEIPLRIATPRVRLSTPDLSRDPSTGSSSDASTSSRGDGSKD